MPPERRWHSLHAAEFVSKAQVAQTANHATAWAQDEWITHPRLIGSSEGHYLVALTAIGALGEVERSSDTGNLSLSMGGAESQVEASAFWAERDGAPTSVSVTIQPADIRFEMG